MTTNFINVGVVHQVTDGKGKFLLSMRTDKCRDEHWRWDPGGGRVEYKETLVSAVERELMEEYCTIPRALRPMGHREVFRENPDSHWVVFDFIVLVDPKAVKIGEPHKMSEIRWLGVQDLIEGIRNQPLLFHSQYGIFVEKYSHFLFGAV